MVMTPLVGMVVMVMVAPLMRIVMMVVTPMLVPVVVGLAFGVEVSDGLHVIGERGLSWG
jgi:hypothetical protein